MDKRGSGSMSSEHLGCDHVLETVMDCWPSWHRHVVGDRAFG